MKERYFTPQSLHSKSLDLLQRIDVYQRRHAARFDPDRSALLVLDMQAYFLEAASHAYIPSAEVIVPLIQELTRAYAARGRPIIYTRHVNSTHDAGRMASWWHDLITDEHPLSSIIAALDVSIGIVIEKSQYDAFYLTPLEDLLRRQTITQLVICGVMTHLCCETTARSAFMRGFEVFFPIDGTATYTEEHHLASLLNLSHGFATPVLMQDILTAVRMRDGT